MSAPAGRATSAIGFGLCLLALLVGWWSNSKVAALTDNLPVTLADKVPADRWAVAARQTLSSSAASDCWNALIAARVINAVYVGESAPNELRRLPTPLNAIRNARVRTFWVLTAKLTELHRKQTPPEEWYKRVEVEINQLVDRPPPLALGELLASATKGYASLGVDPVTAAQLARAHYSYTLCLSVQAIDDLLARTAVGPQAATVTRLRHNLLTTWLNEPNPFVLRWLAADRLAELVNAEQGEALRTWRQTGRAAYEQRTAPAVLQAVSDPTGGPDLQLAWAEHYAYALWLQHGLQVVLIWCGLGLLLAWLTPWRPGALAVGVVVALLLCMGFWLLLPEMRLYSFRLGFPVREDSVAFAPYALVLGGVLPLLGLLFPGGSIRERLGQLSSVAGVSGLLLAILLTRQLATTDNAQKVYQDEAGRFFSSPGQYLTPDLSVPSIPLRGPSE